MKRRRTRAGGWAAVVALGACVFAFSALLQVARAGEVRGETVVAHEYRMAGDAARMRLVMQFDREPDANWFLLRAPHRLVIELENTRFAIAAESTAARGLVRDVRYGQISGAKARIILTLDGPFVVEAFDILENTSAPGFRLVADIVAAADQAFEHALADQLATTGSTRSTAKGDRVVKPAADTDRRFTIVIDPGHGGIDSGARGQTGTLEKDVTLAFAEELRARLEQNSGFLVQLSTPCRTRLRTPKRPRLPPVKTCRTNWPAWRSRTKTMRCPTSSWT